jgi:hypothetical protein
MSNDDDFVDIEEIEDNNAQNNNEDNLNQKEENNLDIQDNNEEDKFILNDEEEAQINQQKTKDYVIENINNNIEINEDKNNTAKNKESLENDLNNENNDGINTLDNNELMQEQNNQLTMKKENVLMPPAKKRNTSRTFDSSIHVHNPVPLSKLQLAENKYYKIREELNKKYFNNNEQNENTEEANSALEAKKNKEMISYLEQLNDVLTEI